MTRWRASRWHLFTCFRLHMCVIGGHSTRVRTTISPLRASRCVELIGGHSSPGRPEIGATAVVLSERRHVWPCANSREAMARLDMVLPGSSGPRSGCTPTKALSQLHLNPGHKLQAKEADLASQSARVSIRYCHCVQLQW